MMTRSEAGRLGGKATVERYGREHMAEIGRKGFNGLVRRLRQGRRAAAALLCSKGRMRPTTPDPDPDSSKFEQMFSELTADPSERRTHR